jgi:hypothetical protein
MISMSFMVATALAPLEFTPSDLNMASLPTQQPANDEDGDGCEQEYVILASVKLWLMNVGLCEGTEEININSKIT